MSESGDHRRDKEIKCSEICSLDARDYSRVGTAAVGVEDLDAYNVDLFGDAVSATADGARAMCSVAVFICILSAGELWNR